MTSLEVTTNATISFNAEGFNECIVQNLNLLWPVIAFEVGLRLLMRFTSKNGEQQYALLGPIYYTVSSLQHSMLAYELLE